MGKWIKPIVIIVVSAFASMLILFALAYALFANSDPIGPSSSYYQTATAIAVTNQAVERYIDMTSTAKASTPTAK